MPTELYKVSEDDFDCHCKEFDADFEPLKQKFISDLQAIIIKHGIPSTTFKITPQISYEEVVAHIQKNQNQG